MAIFASGARGFENAASVARLTTYVDVCAVKDEARAEVIEGFLSVGSFDRQ